MMAERLPPGVYDAKNLKPAYLPNGLEPNGVHCPDANGERHTRSDSINISSLASATGLDAVINGTQGPTQLLRDPLGINENNPCQQSHGILTSNGRDVHSEVRLQNGNGEVQASSSTVPEIVDSKESEPFQDGDSMKGRNSALAGNDNQVEAEWIEQYEPGVHITLVALGDGTRDLKGVRFSRRRFVEHQAETWWSENREKVYDRYNVRGPDKSSVSETLGSKESEPFQDGDSRNSSLAGNGNQVEAEWIEQYESGVYITLAALLDGTRDLKGVRFSRKRFGEHQAETWWSENREKVYDRYNVRRLDKSSVSGQAARRLEGAISPSSQF